MPQTSYSSDPAIGIPGMAADGGPKDVITGLISTQSLYSIEPGTPADSTEYTVTIEQNGASVDYDFTSDASATEAEIVVGLRALIDAGSQLVETVTTAGDTFTIESTSEDYAIVVTVSGGGTGFAATLLVAQAQELPFGVGVVSDPKGTAGLNQVRLPRATGEVTGGTFQGIVMSDVSLEPNAGGYADKSVVPIMRKGRFIFRTESAIAKDGAIYCRFQDPATGYGLGSLRGDADTADAVAIPTAYAKRAAGAGELCIGEINLP